MIDEDKLQNIFEQRYEKILGKHYLTWLKQNINTEIQAYNRLGEIDRMLKATEDQYEQATGPTKERLGDTREQLKMEYEFIEEAFGLESSDANW